MYAEYSPLGEGTDIPNFQPDAVTCGDVRNMLDELFAGRLRLERMEASEKSMLLAHLESCGDCCRAFDARLRFGTPRRAIY